MLGELRVETFVHACAVSALSRRFEGDFILCIVKRKGSGPLKADELIKGYKRDIEAADKFCRICHNLW